MFSRQEKEDIRQLVYQEMARIESRVNHDAGSYGFLCNVMGGPLFCHTPVGPVLRTIYHPE